MISTQRATIDRRHQCDRFLWTRQGEGENAWWHCTGCGCRREELDEGDRLHELEAYAKHVYYDHADDLYVTLEIGAVVETQPPDRVRFVRVADLLPGQEVGWWVRVWPAIYIAPARFRGAAPLSSSGRSFLAQYGEVPR